MERRLIAPLAHGVPPVVALLVAFGAVALLAACGERPAAPVEARLSVAGALGEIDETGYARALGPREPIFPEDHGPHPDFRTEWWYFTGNLVALEPAGASTGGAGAEPRRFGYQLTFFRTAVAPPPGPSTSSAWRTRQVYMAHFAVTDVMGERFFAAERFSRGAAGLAGAAAQPFRVWTESWSAATVAPPEGAGLGPDSQPTGADSLFPLRLVAADGGEGGPVALDLLLGAGKGRVLQGDRGYSEKGEGQGNASYYYSYPRMPTTGTVAVGGETFRVEGASWLDREWSTSVLGEGKAGWDWFALQLDPEEGGGDTSGAGRELVLFRIREASEAGSPGEGSGRPDYLAVVPADPDSAGSGGLRVLDPASASLEVVARWTSPTSGTTYPAAWRLRIPAEALDLRITPRLSDQELNLAFRYWEGAVAVEGISAGEEITGHGYVEMTGYGDANARAR